jgi:cell division septum initiation protein DivIVA
MASEGTSTVPRMGSFRRSFLGYRRSDVDAALASRDARNWALQRDAEEALGRCREAADAAASAEQELGSLSSMVIEREREIRGLLERLSEANDRHDRNVASLEAVSARLEEIQEQARGQATRIRMKALHEAVEVGRRAQELSEAQAGTAAPSAPSANGNDHVEATARDIFEGLVKVEIGPLDDFSQLVGFEVAAVQIGATSVISVERFSEGRATLSMRLDEPVDLLRELEQRSPLDFRVRRTADDNVVLDIDDDSGPEQRAA